MQQKWDIMEITSEENSYESEGTINSHKLEEDKHSLVSSVGIRRSNSSNNLSCGRAMEDLIVESPSPIIQIPTKMKRDT